MDITANIIEDNRLTVDHLPGKVISKIKDDFDNSQYIKNMAYYQVKNPAIISTGAANETAKKNPNNIIPLPFARKTINDLLGYTYKPGNVTYKWGESIPEELTARLEEILEHNEEPLESSEVFREACIKGEGVELMYWQDGEINFVKVPREQCYFEYIDSLKENEIEFAIRFYQTIEILPDGEDLIKHMADYYDKDYRHVYQYNEKEDLKARNQKDYRTADSGSKINYEYQYSIQHPFGMTPLYPYRINDDKMGVFEPSIPMIDKLDGIGSDSIANAIDQFNDTLLLLSKKIDKETAGLIKDSKIIDDLGGKDEGNFAEFLQRNLDISGTLESAKMFERWYYELTQIPNFNDEKFNQKSGIAIAYALVSFENLVTTMETYFTKGLTRRIDLIQAALNNMEGMGEEIEFEIEWKRNLPFDLKERVDVVVALKNAGLLSDETLLKMFPKTIVEDAAEEVKKKEEESIKKAEQFMSNMIPKEEEEDV